MSIVRRLKFDAFGARVCSLLLLVAVFGLSIAPNGEAVAQLTQLPSTAEPGRKAPKPPTPPSALTDLQWSVQLPPGAEPPPALKSETLELKDIRLVGVTAYTRSQLEDLFKDDLGKEITFDRFYAIARAIQQRYRKDGYILTFAYVPPQTVEDGVFSIAVVEGFVERVQTGNIDKDLKATIERVLEPITRVRPLDVTTLERYLLLANDLAGVKVTAVLRPSAKTQGATVLNARVRRDKFDGNASIDNRSSAFTGPWGSSVGAAINSPFGTGERLGVTLSEASRFREKKAISLAFSQPVGVEGTKVDFGVSRTKTAPGSTLKSFEVRTRTTEVTGDVSHPFVRSRAQNLTVGGGFTFRNAAVDLAGSPFNRDRLRLLRTQLNYSNSSILGGSARVILGGTQSFKFLNATDPKEETTSRGDADMYFAKVNLDVVYSRRLFAGINAQVSLTAQHATRPVPASEEFSLGGDGFGRAYNSGEVSGEDGVGFAVELSRAIPVKHHLVRFLEAYGFWDIGKAWDRESPSSTGPAESLSSGGFGVRAGFPFGLTLRLEYDRPITRQPSHQNANKSGRLFFFANWVY